MKVKSNQLTADEAARILAHHLGEDVSSWLEFLSSNRISQRPIRHYTFSSGVHYPDADIYQFIAERNGTSLGINNNSRRFSAEGSTFQIDAQIRVDYEHAAKLVIGIDLPETWYGKRWITPQTARKFAAKLGQLADVCDSHKFNPRYWQVLGKGEKPSFNLSAESTGDAELDSLLEELA
jgi:hypothetical protein